MPEKDAAVRSTAAFTDAFADEDELLRDARDAAQQLGIEPVSPSIGAQLAVIAAASAASAILEVGTGTGVSGLWLLRGAPGAQLTSIDADLDVSQIARRVLADAGVPGRQVRLIPGRAAEVLPRMNEDAYDVVLVDGDPFEVAADLALALAAVRPGGSVLVPHALVGGRVANPAKRDRATVVMRDAFKVIEARDDLLSALSEVGDGLLHVVQRPRRQKA